MALQLNKCLLDGRNKEPITLPVKYPLLLAQGANGIAVGLSSRVLPHNFNEICEAAVKYLRGEEFHLYPDFPTGGAIDVSKYNDGQRGGSVRIRAKIEKLDSKTLVIREIPFTKTADSLQDSITKAIEKGKIKARKVLDLTARDVEIQVQLAPGTSSDKTIDALYAFTDCEISISPNCCIIEDSKPQFLTVSEVLRHSVDNTMGLLRRELQIRRDELMEQLFFASLERIFIEERMYKEKSFEQAPDQKAVLKFLDKRFEPFKEQLVRTITVCGWAKNIRDSKNIGFIALSDGGCFKTLQVVLEAGKLANYDEVVHTGLYSSLRVVGRIVLTPQAKQPFELNADSVEILGDCPADEYPLQKKKGQQM